MTHTIRDIAQAIGAEAAGDLDPVSYTHLDVYKRQEWPLRLTLTAIGKKLLKDGLARRGIPQGGVCCILVNNRCRLASPPREQAQRPVYSIAVLIET